MQEQYTGFMGQLVINGQNALSKHKSIPVALKDTSDSKTVTRLLHASILNFRGCFNSVNSHILELLKQEIAKGGMTATGLQSGNIYWKD